MSDFLQDTFTGWLRQLPVSRGVLARSIRFEDGAIITESTIKEFSAAALEYTWRIVMDAFGGLVEQGLPPDRLVWTHERTITHCLRRKDGIMLMFILSRRIQDLDPALMEKMFFDFQKVGTE